MAGGSPPPQRGRLWWTWRMFQEFPLSEDDLASFSVDAIALEVLRNVVVNEDAMRDSTWFNRSNWVHQLDAQGKIASLQGHAVLSEAWRWLYANCLVASDTTRQNDANAFVVTRLGRLIAEEGLAKTRAIQRLAMDLHPRLEDMVRPQYLMGEYELATFAALRAVEVRVRSLSGSPESSLGVKLMRNAFGDGGTLRDPDMDAGEQTARMELFAGAIGLFKNPPAIVISSSTIRRRRQRSFCLRTF